MGRKPLLVGGLLVAMAAASVLFQALRYGTAPALSPDSVSYLSAARSVAQGRGLVQFDGAPFVHWPPLYPLLLGAFEGRGGDALVAGVWLERLALAVLAVLLGWAVWRWSASAARAAVAAGAVLVARPLGLVAAYLWSEPLFCLFTTAALLLAARYREERETAVFAALVAASAAACLTRNAGVLLVGSVALLLLVPEGRRAASRARTALLYAGLSLVPPAAGWLANTARAGDWLREQIASGPQASGELRLFAETIANWIVPWSLPFEAKAPLALLALAALGAATARGLRHRVPGREAMRAFAVFATAYGLGILGFSLVTAFDPPADRILSPLFAPLAGLAALAWPRPAATRRWLGIAGFALAVVWGVRSAVVTSRSVEWQLRHEETLAAPRWRDSALAAWLAREERQALLYANVPEAVYLYAGRECRQAPRRHFFHAPARSPADLDRFVREVRARGPVLVAWFDGEWGIYLHEPAEYPGALRPEILRRFPDGVLYRVSAVPLEG